MASLKLNGSALGPFPPRFFRGAFLFFLERLNPNPFGKASPLDSTSVRSNCYYWPLSSLGGGRTSEIGEGRKPTTFGKRFVLQFHLVLTHPYPRSMIHVAYDLSRLNDRRLCANGDAG